MNTYSCSTVIALNKILLGHIKHAIIENECNEIDLVASFTYIRRLKLTKGGEKKTKTGHEV